MELTFLGTGSAYPTPTRGASCIIFRHDGTYWMFDCGEGSQIQLMRSSVRAGRISRIFVTHLHGDHMFGLPGLLCTISQNAGAANSTENAQRLTVHIYGPRGLRKFLRASLHLSRSQLGFDYAVHELEPCQEQIPDDWVNWSHYDDTADGELHPNELHGRTITPEVDRLAWNVCEDERLSVWAGMVKHRIPSYGYVIIEKPTPGKLDVEKLKALGIPPGPLYATLKSGKPVVNQANNHTIRPEDVIGPSRPGRRIAILGDTCYSDQMADLCRDVDIIVHEATLSNCMTDNALQKGHSTPEMAARFAESINARYLVLTHFSQRYRSKKKPSSDHLKMSSSCEEYKESSSEQVKEDSNEKVKENSNKQAKKACRKDNKNVFSGDSNKASCEQTTAAAAVDTAATVVFPTVIANPGASATVNPAAANAASASAATTVTAAAAEDDGESIDMLEAEARAVFTRGQVLAVDDFTVLTLPTRDDKKGCLTVTVTSK